VLHPFWVRNGREPILLVAALLVAGCAGGEEGEAAADAAQSHAPEAVQAVGEDCREVPVPAQGPVVRSSFQEAREAGSARITFFFVPSAGFAEWASCGLDDADGSGGLTGVTVELLKDFARFVEETHGIDLEVEWLGEERWADFYGYVRDSEGGVFGIGNVTITEPRREELDFSPPYLNNIAVLVTHEGVPELSSLDEIPVVFRGLAGLPYPGTLHETRVEGIRERYLPETKSRPVASNDELVSLLAAGEEYFGYIDVYNYWRARERGLPLRRHSVGDDASETFGVILPRGSDWTPVMEAFFRAHGGYVDSSRFHGLLRRHLGDGLATLLTGS